MLSDSDSDLHTLTINDHYAKAFEYKKEREELEKLREKYGSDHSGSDAGDSEDSEDTEEDTDGAELTPAVDAAILRTLARIRKKDPAIYEDGRQVFEEEHTQTQGRAPAAKARSKEKSKPLTIREAALASALADVDTHSRAPSPAPRPLTHTEEQARLRSETRAAFREAIDSDSQASGDVEDLLVPRSRTRDEIELEEEEYRVFLEREVGENLHDLVTVGTNKTGDASEDAETVANGDKQKKGKKERGKEKGTSQEDGEVQDKRTAKKRAKKPTEEADQNFLMNYIFNRGWMDRSDRRVPTYNEIIESSSNQSMRMSNKSQVNPGVAEGADPSSNGRLEEAQGVTLSDDESFDDLADAFETSYNFRFEESGGALIASHPRSVSSVRRESATRKEARARKKERQTVEKQALFESRREEIRRERALVEAAVADENASVIGEDSSNQKKSKKQRKKDELARLKTLKAKELRRKLEMVSSEGGIGDEALAHLDLDADWDPSKHDEQMAELYGGEVDIADDGDADKPIWDDDINIDDIAPPMNTKSKAELKNQRKKDRKKSHEAEKDVGVDVEEMDADLEADWNGWDDNDEEWRGTEEERKRKVDGYMNEVMNRLGFSGIASHMPTRFHYTSTAAENYGLTPTEILLATDAELNSYVGLRKMAPYRVDKAKKDWDPKRAQRLKEFRDNLHSRMGLRYEGAWSLDGRTNRAIAVQGEKKKRKGKKERAKLKATQDAKDIEEGDVIDNGVQPIPEVAGKKRKHGPEAVSQSYAPLSDEEKKLDDDVRKKRKRRHKKKTGRETDVVAVP